MVKDEDIQQISMVILELGNINSPISLRQYDCDKQTMLDAQPTILMIAAYLGKEGVFNYLISNGADYRVQDQLKVHFSNFSFSILFSSKISVFFL